MACLTDPTHISVRTRSEPSFVRHFLHNYCTDAPLAGYPMVSYSNHGAFATSVDYMGDGARWCSIVEGLRGGMPGRPETADDELWVLRSRMFRIMFATSCSAVSMDLATVKMFSSSRESSTDCFTANQEAKRTATKSSTLTATITPPRARPLSLPTASTVISSARKLFRKMITQPCGWFDKRVGFAWCGCVKGALEQVLATRTRRKKGDIDR